MIRWISCERKWYTQSRTVGIRAKQPALSLTLSQSTETETDHLTLSHARTLRTDTETDHRTLSHDTDAIEMFDLFCDGALADLADLTLKGLQRGVCAQAM